LKNNNLPVYVMAILAMIFWGVSYVWTTIVFEFYQPVTIMFIRLSVSGILMFMVITFRRQFHRVERSDYKNFLILSFFSPFCYFLAETYGLKHVSPTVASVVIATIPLFAPVLGYMAFREKLSKVNIVGFLISFAGIWIMILDQEFRFTASPKGIILLFLAVISALANIIYLKKLSLKYSPFTIIFIQNTLGALMFFPLFMVFEFRDFLFIRPSLAAIGSLLALAVLGSSLAFIFYTEAVRKIGIARTSIFGNLVPVFAALSSLVVLQEIIDPGKIVGMLLVIGGLFLTQLTRLFKKKEVGRL
jgi:drug/metabolite transporter (DMT)-like permease